MLMRLAGFDSSAAAQVAQAGVAAGALVLTGVFVFATVGVDFGFNGRRQSSSPPQVRLCAGRDAHHVCLLPSMGPCDDSMLLSGPPAVDDLGFALRCCFAYMGLAC